MVLHYGDRFLLKEKAIAPHHSTQRSPPQPHHSDRPYNLTTAIILIKSAENNYADSNRVKEDSI
ncbi:MAG: hypothetical protein VKJ64_05810 [Leptolyngbyaceae bacterium]|nr:hypothetical protein [Leptolyngbyaceae bacterium]